jgi:hypothetical protein
VLGQRQAIYCRVVSSFPLLSRAGTAAAIWWLAVCSGERMLMSATAKKRLAWFLWWVSLLICPLVMTLLGWVYYQPPSPENFLRALPWASYAVEILLYCHIGLMCAAAVAAYWLVPSRWRPDVWWYLVGWLCLTYMWTLATGMAVSGRYL